MKTLIKNEFRQTRKTLLIWLYANKMSFFQNGHPVTQFLYLTQHMGGKKHGSAPAVFLLQNIVESLLDQWV